MVSVALNTNGHWCFDHNGANDIAMAVSYRSVTAHLCNAIDVPFLVPCVGNGPGNALHSISQAGYAWALVNILPQLVSSHL
ncbi:hypothetical protein D1605_010855 [Xylella fastidiosa subsp. fastidiosa]|jgi:uncharacterized membrane protein|uniref:Uncharacterized protein n=1 Tax=Xylella fastidiosa (strain M23) TaxID=405441 RepID=B2IA99_XYLF2|nr:hypothetical protein XfasM23_2139 [Xylella fastidiosa M23]EGO82947.1 hypothetical protein XFEB_00192 [Xylella fastidiosa EB92.1]KGM19803.1 hypothetical protein JT24_11345 [Xylella fastidiosa]MBE0261437.1 hypothetical protein [Xylella fastidiosa subsp. fastidiosa]RWA44899.1 hypothetical protein XfCFBP8356_03580 [Xylella fastidiosa subsp. sandyi]